MVRRYVVPQPSVAVDIVLTGAIGLLVAGRRGKRIAE
jgi:hypothetical protein